LADKLLVYGVLLVLIENGQISSIPVLIILARDFWIMGIRVMAAKNGDIIAADKLGKWKTVLQMIAIPLMIFDIGLGVFVFYVSVVFSLVSGIQYSRMVKN